MPLGFVIPIASSLWAPGCSLKITGCAASAQVMGTHQILLKLPQQEFQDYCFLMMTQSSLFQLASSSFTGCENVCKVESLVAWEIPKDLPGSAKGNI